MKIKFEPQPDITAFELATIISKVTFDPRTAPIGLCAQIDIFYNVWIDMPDTLRRHFKVVE
jgi:hypothetical protein